MSMRQINFTVDSLATCRRRPNTSPARRIVHSSRRALVLLLALVFCCEFAILARAEENLNVLPPEMSGGSTKKMLSRHLRRLTYEALDRRRPEHDKIRTREEVVAYQRRMRAMFIGHLGGFPKRTPLNAKTVGTIDGDGYRIEKIIYESQPRHYVTAIFFLPKSKPPFPAVLVPCGHSRSGKAAQQRVCILLAKYGIAALSYDPIGQGERSQLLDADGKQRFRATSEHDLIGRGSTPLGRNTATFRIWDGMRSIDYLASRKEIDASKIGVTGCSGGGTLTSYLMALDQRVACAAPSCYITSLRRLIETIGPQDAEQNIHGQLAYGMDHADYLMMRAPKPTLILASTHDFFDIQGTWDSFRQAKRFYTRLGFAERVSLVETDAKHGYPKLQREAMVRWMRRFLLGIDEPVTEPEFETHSTSELQCTPDGQVLLMDAARSVVDLNVELNKQLAEERREHWKPENRLRSLEQVRRIAGIRKLNELPRAKVTHHGTIRREGYRIEKLALTSEPGIQLPGLLFVPEKPNGRRYLYLHGEGKHVDASKDGPIDKLASDGNLVLAVDLRGIGEMSTSRDDIVVAYLLAKSLVGMRGEDVLIVARMLSEWEKKDGPGEVHLIASGASASPAIHAAALQSGLFASLKLSDAAASWSDVVRDPTQGKSSDTIHGALRVYDLPDLVAAYRASKKPK